MPEMKPSDIIAMVEAKRETKHALEQRFDRDYDLWRMEEFKETDAEGNPVEGYRSYTSNEPRAFAKKMVSWLSSSETIIEITHRSSMRHIQNNDAQKERWIIGVLNAVDERLRNIGEVALKPNLAWHTSIRGWVCGRALLRKDKEGRTFIDVTPWDLRNTYWEWGEKGIDWACHVTRKTRAQIKALYGVEVPPDSSVLSTRQDETPIDVYDYYDGEDNIVVVKDITLKSAQPHGSPRTPVYLAYVPIQPLVNPAIEEGKDPKDAMADVGESVFDDIRRVYDNYNLIMSVYLELVARQRKGSYTVTSKDGKLVLEGDPFREGAEVPLKEGEKVELLKMVETTKDAQLLAQLVSGEMQRGAIPHTAYGELAFQLSGFAINQLRDGIETVLTPRLECMKSAYMQITQLLQDQYLTGAFEPVEVSGQDRNRSYFDEEIGPEIIRDACGHAIKLLGNLPQDDLTKMNMAQIARTPNAQGIPLLPDEFIRDGVLQLPDADIIRNQLWEQQGETMLPEAMLYTLMRAFENSGRPDMAAMYYEQLLMLMLQKQMQRMGMGLPPTGGQPALPQGQRPGAGILSGAQPFAFQGFAPAPPGPENLGGMVAPGTPRPGAQNGGA